MTLKKLLLSAGAAAIGLPLAGCITVKPPGKPIEINLNVDIKQEVLVRLRDDVDKVIETNPSAFPQGSASKK